MRSLLDSQKPIFIRTNCQLDIQYVERVAKSQLNGMPEGQPDG